jgi:hypothetical protein
MELKKKLSLLFISQIFILALLELDFGRLSF